jgi:hypothetical protein
MTCIAIIDGGTRADILVTIHALVMKRIRPLSGNMTSGAIIRSGRQSHILMAADALAVKRLHPARHMLLVNAALMTFAAMGLALSAHMVTISAIKAEIHAVGVMIEYAEFAQSRNIFALDMMAFPAGNRRSIGGIMVTVAAGEAVEIHMGLMIEQNLPGNGLKHQANRRFRRFSWQRGVEKHADSQTNNGNRITQFGFVL